MLNVTSNFIPNETKRFVSRNPPWINDGLKRKLNKKNRLFKSFKRHGYKNEDKTRLDAFRKECKNDIEKAKSDYLNHLSSKLADSDTPQKVYWKIVSKVFGNFKSSRVPLLLVNGDFITNCNEKAKLIMEFFSN